MKIVKCEYKIEGFKTVGVGTPSGLTDKLDKYSDEGWEIFHISNIVDRGGESFQQFILRRPKSEK